MRAISEIALRDINYPEQVEQIYVDAASKQSLMNSVISQLKNAGTYHFLRLRKIEGAYHPLFRLVHGDGAFAYHEFELMLNSDGRVIASDFYSTVLGRWMQEDIASNLVSDLDLHGIKVEPSANAKLFLAHTKTFKKMLQATQTNEMFLEALLEFRTLPRELQMDRRYLIMATNIAGRISQEELSVEAARFKEHISDEFMLHHILLGLMIQQGDTEQALQIIHHIDKRIGGDKFLDLARANAYLATNRIDEAITSIEGLHFALPDIYAIYRTRAVIACRKHDFELATKILLEIDAQFGSTIDLDRVMDDKEFEEYAASSEFDAIAESFGTGRQ
jgi:tetratricopeptide (TPR) repeat protein